VPVLRGVRSLTLSQLPRSVAETCTENWHVEHESPHQAVWCVGENNSMRMIDVLLHLQVLHGNSGWAKCQAQMAIRTLVSTALQLRCGDALAGAYYTSFFLSQDRDSFISSAVV